MTDPKNTFISDYTYLLPEDRIAKYPLAVRDTSRLLIYKDGCITEDLYKNIAAHIPANTLLVFNNTKVVEARLLFQKPTGGQIEIFCLEPHEQYPDITSAMSQLGKVQWHCLVGGASKWKQGQVLEKKVPYGREELLLSASYIEKNADNFIIELSWTPAEYTFAEVLHVTGAIPLPPYIKRPAESSDADRYQTIYAQTDGSVAAPTAGLHFTPAIFSSMKKSNIDHDFVTLHVGAGTFKPVKTETIGTHEMHAEFIDVKKITIENIIRFLDKTIIPVGTTSLRTIESLYWLGVKKSECKESDSNELLTLSQWEAYDLAKSEMPVKKALQCLLDWMTAQKLDRVLAKTQTIIVPGYKMKIANALITNFHQPRSTLLLLVAALIGQKWRNVYDYALENDFRFLSYGDGSLLWC
jgi:S-adenosylmethionine:tRNA ribosyltransferase-isomerase